MCSLVCHLLCSRPIAPPGTRPSTIRHLTTSCLQEFPIFFGFFLLINGVCVSSQESCYKIVIRPLPDLSCSLLCLLFRCFCPCRSLLRRRGAPPSQTKILQPRNANGRPDAPIPPGVDSLRFSSGSSSSSSSSRLRRLRHLRRRSNG